MTIQEALTDAGIDFLESGHHHSRPGWIQVRDCPFCGSQKYHLGFNIASRFWNCWRCGGHTHWSVAKELKIPFQKTQPDKDAPQLDRTRTKLVEPKGRGDLSAAHCEYLAKRQLDFRDAVNLWQAQGICIAARLSWRLYIPIVHEGQRVSWTTRAIGDSVEQRYVSASAQEEAVNHKHVCYGLDYVRDTAIVVEGPLDVWKVGPGAVGLFGTAYSTAQVRQLSRVPNRFVCFDRSREAQDIAKKLAHELSCFPGRTQLLEIDAEDPGSASKKEVALIRRTCGLDFR